MVQIKFVKEIPIINGTYKKILLMERSAIKNGELEKHMKLKWNMK